MIEYTLNESTKLALRIAEIDDISIFADMNKDELRTKYPRLNIGAFLL